MKEKIQEIVDNPYNSSYFNDRTFLNHPWRKKEFVIEEITNTFPEESFCFLNEKSLRERINFIHENFLPWNQNSFLAYAVKTNSRNRLIEIAKQEWVTHYDCASLNEIWKTLNIQPDAKILFNHPIKQSSSIKKSHDLWVDHFTVQTNDEIKKILKSIWDQKDVELALRFKTLNENAWVNLSEKFGNLHPEILEMVNYIRNNTNYNLWFSIHTGSQNEDSNTFSSAIDELWNVLKWVSNVSTINLWWWIPVDYKNERKNMQAYFDVINDSVKKNFWWDKFENTKFVTELWRFVVADSVDLVIPILSVENIAWEKIIHMNDWIFTSFSDLAVHNWSYDFQVKKKNWKLSEVFEKYKLYWRTCDSWDCLWNIMLPSNLEEGDFIYIEKAGAYMDSQSTNFNWFEPPKYVSYNL